MILAIDPGNELSAYVVYDGAKPIDFGKVPNKWLLDRVQCGHFDAPHMAVEMIASYGMPVGREVFETCLYIGKLLQAWPHGHTLVYRRDVKLHLCGQARARDGNVRQSVIDRYGGKSAIKKGGVLYRVTADIWSALAIAIVWTETHARKEAA